MDLSTFKVMSAGWVGDVGDSVSKVGQEADISNVPTYVFGAFALVVVAVVIALLFAGVTNQAKKGTNDAKALGAAKETDKNAIIAFVIVIGIIIVGGVVVTMLGFI